MVIKTPINNKINSLAKTKKAEELKETNKSNNKRD